MFVEYYTYDYHYASRLNPRLYDIVRENLDYDVMGGASITPGLDLHTRGIKDVDILITWIKNIIPGVAFKFANSGEGEVDKDVYKNIGFNVNSFKITECWGVHYNKGQKVVKHNHFPYTLSFCYCVSAPPKSSPFILEGERISPVPGRIIFFLSHQYHGTLSSKVDGRCMIVGNVLYTV